MDIKKVALEHWKYTDGIIKLSWLYTIAPERYAKLFLSLCKYCYIQAFIHGYKHGQEDL